MQVKRDELKNKGSNAGQTNGQKTKEELHIMNAFGNHVADELWKFMVKMFGAAHDMKEEKRRTKEGLVVIMTEMMEPFQKNERKIARAEARAAELAIRAGNWMNNILKVRGGLDVKWAEFLGDNFPDVNSQAALSYLALAQGLTIEEQEKLYLLGLPLLSRLLPFAQKARKSVTDILLDADLDWPEEPPENIEDWNEVRCFKAQVANLISGQSE